MTAVNAFPRNLTPNMAVNCQGNDKEAVLQWWNDWTGPLLDSHLATIGLLYSAEYLGSHSVYRSHMTKHVVYLPSTGFTLASLAAWLAPYWRYSNSLA